MGVAATAAALVLAAIVVLPRRRPGIPTLATSLLAAQAGSAVVGGAVLIGAALRGAHLITRPAGAEEAASLLRLSGLDGDDAGFFRLMAGLVAVLGGLLVVVLALAARCAADADPVNRALATAVLIVEAVGCGGALVLVVLGQRGLPFTVPAAALPLVVLAAVATWPRPPIDPAAASAPGIGYNERHG